MFVAKDPNPSVQDRAPPHGGCLDLRSLSFNYDTSFDARIMTTEKFQLRYSPVENRIFIIVTDEVGQEEVFGLTRRLVKHLVPSVEKVLQAFGHLVEPTMPDTHRKPGFRVPPTIRCRDRTRARKSRRDPAGRRRRQARPPRASSSVCALSTECNGVHVLHMTDGRRHLNVPLTDEPLTQFSHGIVGVLGNADGDLERIDIGESESTTTATKIDITAESPSKYRQ
jgi:hypothetical protein